MKKNKSLLLILLVLGISLVSINAIAANANSKPLENIVPNKSNLHYSMENVTTSAHLGIPINQTYSYDTNDVLAGGTVNLTAYLATPVNALITTPKYTYSNSTIPVSLQTKFSNLTLKLKMLFNLWLFGKNVVNLNLFDYEYNYTSPVINSNKLSFPIRLETQIQDIPSVEILGRKVTPEVYLYSDYTVDLAFNLVNQLIYGRTSFTQNNLVNTNKTYDLAIGKQTNSEIYLINNDTLYLDNIGLNFNGFGLDIKWLGNDAYLNYNIGEINLLTVPIGTPIEYKTTRPVIKLDNSTPTISKVNLYENGYFTVEFNDDSYIEKLVVLYDNGKNQTFTVRSLYFSTILDSNQTIKKLIFYDSVGRQNEYSNIKMESITNPINNSNHNLFNNLNPYYVVFGIPLIIFFYQLIMPKKKNSI